MCGWRAAESQRPRDSGQTGGRAGGRRPHVALRSHRFLGRGQELAGPAATTAYGRPPPLAPCLQEAAAATSAPRSCKVVVQQV